MYDGVQNKVSSCLTLLHREKVVRIVFDTRPLYLTRRDKWRSIFYTLQHPDINTHLFCVMQDWLRLRLRYLLRVEESGTEVRQLSLIELPRFVVNARAKELAFVFRIEYVTLSQKKLARSGLRLWQRVTDTPVGFKLSRRIVTTLQAVLDLLLTIHLNVGEVIRQMIRSTRCQDCRFAVAVEREEPNTGHTV